MLKYYFEKEFDPDGNEIDNKKLFDGLNIFRCRVKSIQIHGQYPVISLSLKCAKQPDFQTAYECLVDEIAQEFDRHSYILLNSKLNSSEKINFGK